MHRYRHSYMHILMRMHTHVLLLRMFLRMSMCVRVPHAQLYGTENGLVGQLPADASTMQRGWVV